MINTIEKINNEIKSFFGDSLVSIATFGSSVRRKKFKIRSDIDYIIILSRLSRPQDVLSRKLKKRLKNIFPLVAFNIYSKKDFYAILKYNAWLILTIKLGYEVYDDKNHFFKSAIEDAFQNLKQRKVGRLAWYIENQELQKSFLDHYLSVSKEYLQAAQLLYRHHFLSFAIETLLTATHCFMIQKLLERKFFITTGEITQLFFNVYSDHEIFDLRDSLLKLEQKSGQKHSFDFDKKGEMRFLPNDAKELKAVFNNGVKSLNRLQSFFDGNSKQND